MDPNNPASPNPNPVPDPVQAPPVPDVAPAVPPPSVDLPQAPISADLPPTPTPVEPAAPPPPPVWDTPAPAPDVSFAQPAPPAPAPAMPNNDWSTPVAPVEPAVPASSDVAPVASEPAWPQPAAEAPPPAMPDAPPAPEPVAAPEQTAAANMDFSQNAPTEAAPSESAPTDLSSLAAALGAPNINGVQAAPVDPGAPTLPPQVPAQATNPDTPTVVTGSHGVHIPKAVLIVGAIVGLLAVVGASAYFILGVGQTDETTSLPAQQQPLTNPPRTTVPTPTPVTNLDNDTTLGNISGASPSAQASESGTIAPGTSIFDRRATQ